MWGKEKGFGKLWVFSKNRDENQSVESVWLINWGAGQWKNLEGLLEIKESIQAPYLKQRNFHVRGVIHVKFYANAWIVWYMHVFDFHEPLLFVKIWTFGKFPEIAWQAIHSCQVAHSVGVFLGSFEESPGGEPYTAKRRKPVTHLWVLWWRAWRRCLNHQAARTKFWFDFGVLSVVGWL